MGEKLRGGRLRFRRLLESDVGIVTGVTYHGAPRGAREVDRACRETEPSTTLAFADEGGRRTMAHADDRGVYRLDLPPGIYRVTATWLRGAGGKGSRTLDDVEVTAGHTTVLDVRLLAEPMP